ncbi:MAG: amidase family protein [Ramlibacter sp.]
MQTDLALLTISEAASLIEQRKLSPVDLTQACIARTHALDPMLNAYVTFTPERALEAARQAEAEITNGNYRGPMHSIPVGLKDIYDTAGIPSTAHSKLLQTRVPLEDAFTVAKLKAAGTVITGKLGTFEFAIGGPSFDLFVPPARNPWDTSRTTGGSSSGSGAAVAAGLVLGATGSDTGGSIRSPSWRSSWWATPSRNPRCSSLATPTNRRRSGVRAGPRSRAHEALRARAGWAGGRAEAAGAGGLVPPRPGR